MKKIDPPVHDDNNELDILSKNEGLGSYPELKANLAVIKRQYQEYLNHNGDPWLIRTCGLSTGLQNALKTHYSAPPKDRLGFIGEYRRDLSPDFCPMCGGLGMGTLDHYLPKADFAEFSIFSRNLVPACGCNQLRGTTIKGNAAPERVIHPYFDTFLDQRLYQAVFDGDYEAPSISVGIINSGHPEIDILKFHLESVILNNNIINWLEKRWGALYRRPNDLLEIVLPDGLINDDQLKGGVEKYLRVKDKEYETPNNWWSILYSGLLNDSGRLKKLTSEINLSRS